MDVARLGSMSAFRLASGACAGLMLLPLSVWTLAAQQQPIFKSKPTVTVPVFVTVLDAERRLVPGLVKEDFSILDDSRPVEVSLFDNTVRPITVVVMLDTSGSMTLNIELL